ncbi:MAG: TolC family protein, partial [Rhodothalassiaceae bacterium]
MKIPYLTGALLGVAIHAQALAASDAPLTLDAAVRLALEADDPSVRQFEEQAAALAEKAVAESQLPDPQLGLTMINLPTSFSFTQENMTQFQTSLSQSFPAGRTLSLRGAKRRAESAGAREAARLRELEIIRETRRAWLEMFYWAQAQRQIRESREAVTDLEVATRADYAAGRGSSQALMRTRLELSLLDDRLLEAERQYAIARANLARFIGEAAARRALPQDMPVLKAPEAPDALRELLLRHPAVRITDSTIEAR